MPCARTIHGSDSSANQGGKKGTKGFDRYRPKGGARSYGIWAADSGADGYFAYDYEHNDYPDGNYDSYNTNTYTAEEDYSWEEDYTEAYIEDQALAEWTPAEDAEQEELDAFAAFAQARGKGKRKGKGKSKGKKGPDAPAGSTREYKATGTIVFTEQQKAERRIRIAQVKSRTACSACGRVGHWQGDPECPKNTTKKGETGKGREAHGYFVCVEDPMVLLTPTLCRTCCWASSDFASVFVKQDPSQVAMGVPGGWTVPHARRGWRQSVASELKERRKHVGCT